MVDERNIDQIDWSVTTWEGSRLEQIVRRSKISLDEILNAQEEMADISAELAEQSASP